MSEFDDIKRRKLEEFSAYAQEKQKQNAETQQQFEQLEAGVKKYFTPDALVRYGNIRTAHPDTALQVVVALARAIQSGQLRQMISDEMLRAVLSQLNVQHEIKITRK